MRIAIFFLCVPLALAAAGCEDSSAGQAGDACPKRGGAAGSRCANVACSAFPTNPGCKDVAPVSGHCPLGYTQCFDPADSDHLRFYCDPTVTKGVCGTRKAMPPAACSAPLCSQADVTACYDTISDDFCRPPYSCIHFDCTPDGGSDAGSDAANNG